MPEPKCVDESRNYRALERMIKNELSGAGGVTVDHKTINVQVNEFGVQTRLIERLAGETLARDHTSSWRYDLDTRPQGPTEVELSRRKRMTGLARSEPSRSW